MRLEFIGWAAVMAATAILVVLAPVLLFLVAVLLAAFAIVWNLATAAVLPVAMERQGGIWESFRAGMSVSWSHRGRWWLLLLAQMILLGFVIVFIGRGNFSWNVNVFWTGGYDHDCRWYGKLADLFHSATLPLVDTLLALLFGAFAVAVKLTIIQRLQSEALPAMTPGGNRAVGEVLTSAQRAADILKRSGASP